MTASSSSPSHVNPVINMSVSDNLSTSSVTLKRSQTNNYSSFNKAKISQHSQLFLEPHKSGRNHNHCQQPYMNASSQQNSSVYRYQSLAGSVSHPRANFIKMSAQQNESIDNQGSDDIYQEIHKVQERDQKNYDKLKSNSNKFNVQMNEATDKGNSEQNQKQFRFRDHPYVCWTLVLILFGKMTNQWARKFISYASGYTVPDAIVGREFYEIATFFPQLESYYGLLSGLAYTVPYLLSGLIFGSITGKVNRVKTCALTFLIGGLSQFLTGAIPNFKLLFGMRMLHAACNSATNPLLYSIVADVVPPERRATANSFISTAVYAGISLSSLSILLIRQIGWQVTQQLMGVIIGFIGLLYLFTLKEPKFRKDGRILTPEEFQLMQQENEEESSGEKKKTSAKDLLIDMKETIFDLWNVPTPKWITIGSFIRTFSGISSAIYLPIYFLKVYPQYKTQYSIINAFSLAFGGLVSNLISGILSDRLETKTNLTAKSKICIVSSFLAFPLTALCCLVQNNFWFSISAITLKTLLSASFNSPAMTMMQNTTDSKHVGKIISGHMFYQTIAGGVCPLIFSKIATAMGASATPALYGKLLAVFALLGYWGSIPFWWLAGRSYKEFVQRRDQEKDAGEVAALPA